MVSQATLRVTIELLAAVNDFSESAQDEAMWEAFYRLSQEFIANPLQELFYSNPDLIVYLVTLGQLKDLKSNRDSAANPSFLHRFLDALFSILPASSQSLFCLFSTGLPVERSSRFRSTSGRIDILQNRLFVPEEFLNEGTKEVVLRLQSEGLPGDLHEWINTE